MSSSSRPSLGYSHVPANSVGVSSHYDHDDDEGVAGGVGGARPRVAEPDELLVDPSCSCCCACSRRGVGEKGSCCSWLTFLLLFAMIAFCVVCGSVVYSVNLVSHLLSLCHQMRKAFILLPIFTGVFWIVGALLMVRSFRWRQRQHQRKLTNLALVQESFLRPTTITSAALDDAEPKKRCTCRHASRIAISATFWTLFVALNATILVVFSGLVYLEVHTLPKNTGTMSMGSGHLSGPVTVSRTDHNILHIRSVDPKSAERSEYDLFFGQGVGHAQERLWQMEFQRAVGTGRLGELTGFNDDVVKIDKLARTMNYYAYAATAFTSLSTRSQAIIQAYCDGVNAYLGSSELTLPIEFILLGLSKPAPWQPADVLVWTKIVSYMLSGNLDMELERWDLHTMLHKSMERVNELLPKYDATKFPIIYSEDEIPEEDMHGFRYNQDTRELPMAEWFRGPEGQAYRARVEAAGAGGRTLTHPQSAFSVFRKMFGPSTASNNWVIGPARTVRDAPIMCNDPHLQLMAPSIWILNHLNSPTFHAVGASFVGTPGIILGHNRNISWSVTNVGADVQDLFIMSGNYTHYQWQGEWYAYTMREETIRVKHGDDIVMVVREASQYGPVISDLGTSLEDYDLSVGPALALRWTSLDHNDTTFDAFLGLNTARNWTEFQAATALYRAPSQNMIYADNAGNIGYQTTGLIPVRPNNGTGLAPVPGNGTFDWLPADQWVPFADMPRMFNPKKGYVASANNAVVPDGFKVYLTGDWDAGSDGYRAKRITEMIVGPAGETKPPLHDVNSVVAMQTDYLSGIVQDFQASIFPLLTASTTAGVDMLTSWRNWDGVMAVGSVDAQRFERFYLGLQTLAGKETNGTRWDDAMWIFNTYSHRFPLQPDANCVWSSDASQIRNTSTCLGFANTQLDYIANLDSADQRWGQDCHAARYTHQVLGATLLACVANREVAHGGDKSTINVGTPDVPDDETGATDPLTQLHGPSYRQIIDWSDVDGRSQFVFGPGQSGNLLSASYDDLVDLWANQGYVPMNPNELVTNTLTLEP